MIVYFSTDRVYVYSKACVVQTTSVFLTNITSIVSEVLQHSIRAGPRPWRSTGRGAFLAGGRPALGPLVDTKKQGRLAIWCRQACCVAAGDWAPLWAVSTARVEEGGGGLTAGAGEETTG